MFIKLFLYILLTTILDITVKMKGTIIHVAKPYWSLNSTIFIILKIMPKFMLKSDTMLNISWIPISKNVCYPSIDNIVITKETK